MKTHGKILSAIAFMAVLSMYACNETIEEVEPEPVNPVAKILMAHSWRYTDTLYLNKSGTFYPYEMPHCLLDDQLDYLAPGQYIKEPGSKLCSGQTQKKDTLGWKLINDNKQLEITNKGTVIKNDIVLLSADSLMLSSVTPIGDTQVFLYLKYK